MKIKKIVVFALIIPALSFFLYTCTVNSSTGLITITNTTQNDISSIVIGDITISSYISRGSKVDYWYSTQLSGRLQFGGQPRPFIVQEDNGDETRDKTTSLVFKLDCEYKIDIIEYNNQNWFYFYKGKKIGSDYDSSGANVKPWD